MPKPRWLQLLMYGRVASMPQRLPMPSDEWDAWKRKQQAHFVEEEAKVRGVVEETRVAIEITKGQARRGVAADSAS